MDFDSWKSSKDGNNIEIWKQDYSTPYIIPGVKKIPLKSFVDDGGKFMEIQRLIGGYIKDGDLDIRVSQISYSEILPGSIKAFHIHERQFDVWFVPPSSRLIIGLFDPKIYKFRPLEQESKDKNPNMRFVLGDGNAELLIIPPGIAHGCANPYRERASLFYMTSEVFTTGENCDEGRMPWDLLGEDFWEISKG